MNAEFWYLKTGTRESYHQSNIQSMIHTFSHAKAWFFTGESLLCDWEPCLVSQLSWLKGACNRFQTHKRFKRLEVYKSDVVAQCCTMKNKANGSQLSDWFLNIEWALTWLAARIWLPTCKSNWYTKWCNLNLDGEIWLTQPWNLFEIQSSPFTQKLLSCLLHFTQLR